MSLRYDTSITRQSSLTRILSMICGDGPVFDVGCATGHLGEALRSLNKSNEIFGLEIDSEARAIALQKKIYEDIYLVDLDGTMEPMPWLKGYFKYIVLADVLEHLKNAEHVLTSLIPYLRKDGCFLISLPNVMNFEVQATMASATAKYTETGLLDYSHLHFYDFNGIAELCTNASCVIRNLSFTYMNVENIYRLSEPEIMPPQVSNFIFENNPYAWEFQYVFELFPSGMSKDHLLKINQEVFQRSGTRIDNKRQKSYVISGLLKMYYRTEDETFSEEKSLCYPFFVHNGILSLDIVLDELSEKDTFLRIDFGRSGEVWEWGHILWYDKDDTLITGVDLETLKKEGGFCGITVSNHHFKIRDNASIFLKRNSDMHRLGMRMSVVDTEPQDMGNKILCYFSGEDGHFDETKVTESFLTPTGQGMLSGEFSIPDAIDSLSQFRIDLYGLKDVYELCSCYVFDNDAHKIPIDLLKAENRLGVFCFSENDIDYFFMSDHHRASFQFSVNNFAVKRITLQLKPVVIGDKFRALESECKEHKTYETAFRKTEDILRKTFGERDALDEQNRFLKKELESEREEHKTYEAAFRKTEDSLRKTFLERDALNERNRLLKEEVESEREEHKTCEAALHKTEDILHQKCLDCEVLDGKNKELSSIIENNNAIIDSQRQQIECLTSKAELLNVVLNSRSWRYTALFRKVGRGLRYMRTQGVRAFFKKISQKIEKKSTVYARLMGFQRSVRDTRKAEGTRKALSYVFNKIYAKLFPARYAQRIYKDYCERFKHSCLIIDHNLGGGANVYRNNLIKGKLSKGEKCILLHNNMYFYDHRDYSLKFYENSLEQFEDVHLNDLREVFAILDKISPSLVVYNSLVFYPDISSVLHWMGNCKGKLLLLMHDFFPICQVYNMVDDKKEYCRSNRDCDECLANHWDIRHLYGKPFSKSQWQKLWSPVFDKSEEIRFFSVATQEIVKAWGVGNEEKYRVIPHSMDYFTPPEVKLVWGKKTNLAVIGIIYNIPKGVLFVEQLAKRIAPAPLIVIGTYKGKPVDNIIETGPFTRETLPEYIEKYSINMLLLPSICPETFSYLTSEIIMMKIPLLTFDLGAQGDKVAKYDLGAVVPQMTPDSVLETADKLYQRITKDV